MRDPIPDVYKYYKCSSTTNVKNMHLHRTKCPQIMRDPIPDVYKYYKCSSTTNVKNMHLHRWRPSRNLKKGIHKVNFTYIPNKLLNNVYDMAL